MGKKNNDDEQIFYIRPEDQEEIENDYDRELTEEEEENLRDFEENVGGSSGEDNDGCFYQIAKLIRSLLGG